MRDQKLRYGMVGGKKGAFIGAVHRMAIAVEETAELCAGCFGRNEEENRKTGEFYDIASDRIYSDFKEMAEKEGAREDGIDFVCITTPNNTHYEAAKAFLNAGISVSCEKPLVFTVEEAEELKSLAEEKNLLFAVTYTYTGYNMVKFAKELVAAGEIGKVVNVNAEYLQDWLIDEIGNGDDTTSKMSVWRMSAENSGISNCVGDIGTHIESIVRYITGLKTKKVSAVLDKFGHELDLNANILVELENGAHGVFCCSQICAGHYNGLVVRIFGTEGAIEWIQEEPNSLRVTRKGQPTQIYQRGTGNITGLAAKRNHIPSGHPEGLVMAFANIYRAFMDALLKLKNNEKPDENDMDFTDVDYGLDGVKFIHAVVKSSEDDSSWKEL